MNNKSYKRFEKSVKECDSTCNHFYVRYPKGRKQIHYMLYCTNHGYCTGMNRETAESNILEGAVCVFKGNEMPTNETFHKFIKKTDKYRERLRRKEVQTS